MTKAFRILSVWLVAGLLATSAFAQVLTQSTIAVNAGTVRASLSGAGSVTITITGTWIGTLQFETMSDGSNFNSRELLDKSDDSKDTSTTGNGVWALQNEGYTQVQVRASAWTSGTATITITRGAGLASSSSATIEGEGARRRGPEARLQVAQGIPPDGHERLQPSGGRQCLKPLAAAGSDEQGTHFDPFGGFLLPTAFQPTMLMVRPEDDPTANLTLRNGSAVTNLAAGSIRITATSTSLNVNCTGGCSGGTQYAEDIAHTTGDAMTMAGGVRRDTAASGATADGDIATLNVNNVGRLYTSATIDALPAGANVIGAVTQSAHGTSVP